MFMATRCMNTYEKPLLVKSWVAAVRLIITAAASVKSSTVTTGTCRLHLVNKEGWQDMIPCGKVETVLSQYIVIMIAVVH